LIEENVLIEIATVTYSKSLWMILKETEATVDECLSLVGSIIDPNQEHLVNKHCHLYMIHL
jgi:hypothetical protein